MRKLMIVAMLVASAIAADAQRGNDRRDNGYNNRDSYDNRNGGYDRRGDSRRDSRGGNNFDRIDSYQREARRQIAFGIESGRITSRESKRLLREVEQIEYKENRYKRDGNLDPRERKDLIEDLTVLNRWINREKRDGDRVTYDDFSRGNRNTNDRRSDDRYDERNGRRY
ncbi:hypothetical protein [Emticicia sp.]|uniref:hypothetical protein n=1 Tax=Emticicia sp. TaxID=1930953 RepID=UPI003752D90A